MFNEAVITMDGLELDAKIRAGHAVATFTHVKLGNGTYDGTEDLSIITNMKSIKQSFGISSIVVTDNKTVRLRTVSDNTNIDEGYLISEIGIFAQDPDKGEVLYSIALGVDGKMDYQPSESELPGATSTFDTYVSVSNVEAATILTDCGAAASAEDLEEIKCPEFDDSGEVEAITSFPVFLEKVKSKMNIFEFFKNLKAGLKFVLHTGQIVNNCVSTNEKLPLSAAQGKILMDLINQTNGNFQNVSKLNVVNTFQTTQQIRTSGDVKLRLISTDADNYSLIEVCDSDDNVLSRFGYAGAYGWIIGDRDHKLITNSDLELKQYEIIRPPTNNVFTSFSTWNCVAAKSGKTVTLRLNFIGNMSAVNTESTIFELPQTYRPQWSIIINYITQNGNKMLLVINANGEVQLSNFNTALNGDWICRQCITYVTDK